MLNCVALRLLAVFLVIRLRLCGSRVSPFIMSRAQHRQAGAIPFYSCVFGISLDRGAVVTYGEVRISKLRLTSFMKMLLYRILN